MADNTGRNVAIGVILLIVLIGFGAAAADVIDDDEPDDDDPDPDDPLVPGPIDVPGVPFQPPGPGEDPFIVTVIPIQDPPINDILNDFPTGGAFYQVEFGDQFFHSSTSRSIVKRWLRTEAFTAAQEFGGLDDAEANIFAKGVAGNASLRVQGLDLIQCAYFNDKAYGTWGYGSQAQASPHGRAIRLLKQHPNNLRRLRDGKPAGRNIRLRTPADKGKGNALGVQKELRDAFELLWLPELNKETLWESGGTELSTQGVVWPDGSSKMNPPPWIMALDIVDFSDSGFGDWGC